MNAEPSTKRVGAWAAGVFGFLLITLGGRDAVGFGYVLFLVLPAAAGFALGIVTRPRATIWTAVAFCLLWGVPFLILGQWEGILCCLLAAPVVLPGIVIGAAVGHFMKRRHSRLPSAAALLVAALLVVGAAGVEHLDRPDPAILRVSSSALLRASPEHAWQHLLVIDAITVPSRC